MTDSNRVPADRAIVIRFVDHLREAGQTDLKVNRWPEDEKPGQSEIEAIAGNLAIEHTSIDTLPNQRRDGEWFIEALASVERIFVPFRLRVLVPYELVVKGADWAAFARRLSDWITTVAPILPDGVHEVDLLPGTVLRLAVQKSSGLTPGVFLRRPEPDDDTLASRVGDQIRRKCKKLERYKAEGYTTVLLLETKDTALMNQHKMLEAAREGMGGVMMPGIDQIWYVEADGYVAIDLTSALKDGHDELG
jgi:hypothetical protein